MVNGFSFFLCVVVESCLYTTTSGGCGAGWFLGLGFGLDCLLVVQVAADSKGYEAQN